VRTIGGIWISGGLVAGAGALEYLWRSNLTPAFAGLCVAGGIALVLAFGATARAAAKEGSRLPLIGVPLFFVGYLTLFFGVGAAWSLRSAALTLASPTRPTLAWPVGRNDL
jgi:hypothetical protein